MAQTERALLGLGERTLVRIDPASLAVIDSAELPTGVRIIGHDVTRLVALHKRSRALLVLDAGAFAGSLQDAITTLATVITVKGRG